MAIEDDIVGKKSKKPNVQNWTDDSTFKEGLRTKYRLPVGMFIVTTDILIIFYKLSDLAVDVLDEHPNCIRLLRLAAKLRLTGLLGPTQCANLKSRLDRNVRC